jgi:hypothetical protein
VGFNLALEPDAPGTMLFIRKIDNDSFMVTKIDGSLSSVAAEKAAKAAKTAKAAAEPEPESESNLYDTDSGDDDDDMI